MNATTDILRGELERLFELDPMKKLSSDLMGLDPEDVGGTSARGAFARALVERCAREDALEALADAILLSAKGVDERVRTAFDGTQGEELKAGTVVAGFRVVKKIGEGGLGVVYYAERKDGETATRAALKVIRAEFARDRAAVRRYLTVSRALAAVKSPVLAQVLAAGQLEDGRPYTIAQYVEGQTLSARIQRTGPLHFNEARGVVTSVLAALSTMHARGMVHGDVKTENVFVTRTTIEGSDRAEVTGTLVDAGTDRLLVRTAAPVDRTGFIPLFGTAKSMAPEVARGGQVDARSDVYATGAMLYEALVGKPPFTGKSTIDIVMQHLMQAPEAPSKNAPRGWVTRELDEIVLKALAKDPAERFQSAQEMAAACDRVSRVSQSQIPKPMGKLDEAALGKAVAALKGKPEDEDLAVAVERVCEPANAWGDAVKIFSEVSDLAKATEAKKALLYRVVRIQEAELEDLHAAEETYVKILAIDPNDDIAQVGIEEVRRSTGNNEGLVELLLEKVEKAETSDERASILREMAQLYEERLHQEDSAFVAWVQALGEEPRDERTLREIERLANTPERWNEVVSTLNEVVQGSTDTTANVPLYVLLGRWYADKLQRPDFALSCYSQALAADPSNDDALDGTVTLYRKAQAWSDLVGILLRRADASTNPAKARDVRAEAAEIMAQKLNEVDRAAEIWKAIIDADISHPKASAGLETIYTHRESWKELAALLEARVKSERGQNKVETLCQIAELFEDRLDNRDQAALHYEQALAIDTHNLVALKGLERIYARVGKYTELLENLKVQLELSATPRQRIALWERMGAICEEEFVDHAKAAELYEEIVKVEPGNDAANTALTRVYRALHRFDDLAHTLERHAKATTDEKRKHDLMMQEVRVLMVDIGAPERALAVCERILVLRPQDTEALEHVARLKAKSGDAGAALDAVERLAEAEKDAEKRADLWLRAGRLLEESGDNDRAIERYKHALDASPRHTAATAALRNVFMARGDAHGAAEILRREIDAAQGAAVKAKLLAELGTLHLERMHEKDKARELFTQAIGLDGTCTPAAQALGEMAFEGGNFAEAVRYLEPLLARTSAMTPKAARDVSMKCGEAMQSLGLFDKAQRAYLNAKAFAKDDLEVLERVAAVTFESGAADEAAEMYSDIAKRFAGKLVGGDHGRVLYRLGEASRRAKDYETAIGALNKAAELLSDDRSPLVSLKLVFEEQGRWDQVIKTLRRLAEVGSDDDRFNSLVEIGDVQLEKQKDKPGASKTYLAALELRGDDRNLLTKLMQVYSESKDWSRLVEVVLRIAELVEDPKMLGRYYYTAGSISLRELQRVDEAAEYYEQALEHDGSLQKAFEGLIECLTMRADWKRVESAYRAQLKRIDTTGTDEQKAHIYDSLGELLQHRLSRSSDAVEAYEEAQKLDPESRRRVEQLAEIYTAEPKRYYQKAIQTQGILLQKSPYRVESYQALRKLYTDVKKADESWCVCQALVALKMAEPDEESFFKKHRSRSPAKAQERFTDDLWNRFVIHPQQDPLLTAIFATIEPAVIATSSQPLKTFGVEASNKRNAEKDPAPLAQMLHYAAGVTDVRLPDVYYREGDDGALSFLFAQPPAIGLGQGARGEGPPAQAVAFVAGRHLSYMRPGHYLRHLVPTGSGLRAWLLAAIKSATPQFPVPGDLEAVIAQHITAFRAHLAGPDQDKLRSLVQRLLAAAPELDMKRWVAAVDLTADRVGFVLANELALSTAVIKASPEDSAAASQKDRLKELFLYSVSEDYLSLRHKLGIAMGAT